jgi:hypothetical protein
MSATERLFGAELVEDVSKAVDVADALAFVEPRRDEASKAVSATRVETRFWPAVGDEGAVLDEP